ncbi:MAG: molecular chaperone HtpG [Coriobacteriales bacterium]|jgi:molecular chaperone HtpG
MRKFKTESKKLLDLMVNSIYTNKEIFLRELISNASDSLDKLYLSALEKSDNSINRKDLRIDIAFDKDARTITVSDNGIGMTKDELDKNLGVIAHSGSLDFKTDDEKDLEKVDIIGQFGVGFYSSFMVADKVTVISRAYGSDEAAKWESDGVEGYTITDAERSERGTDIILHLRENDENADYDHYLSEGTLKSLVKRYSDYIRYPICMDVTKQREKPKPEDAGDDYKPEYEDYTENETLNSMVPIWTKKKSDVTDEEYNDFYKSRFHDSEDPLRVISLHAEGTISYDALLFIPKKPPYDLYSKDFKRGLALYSNNVMIMEQCEDLLPDCFGFVRGVVDSPDLNLNISREMLQHDRQLHAIEHRIEKKVAQELDKMLNDDRETYEDFYSKFGHAFKYAIYSSYGAEKDTLQDLLLFYSARDEKLITLAEYDEAEAEDQKEVYYAYGDSTARLAASPSVRSIVEKGYDVLLCSDNVDEFCLMTIGMYGGKQFRNVADQDLDLGSEEEKEEAKKVDEDNEALFNAMCSSLGDEVTKVTASTRLTDDEAACITADGPVSLGMEKYFNSLPEGEDRPEAKHILEINPKHPVFETLKAAQSLGDTEKVDTYTTILYNQALIAEGLDVADPVAYNKAILSLMK